MPLQDAFLVGLGFREHLLDSLEACDRGGVARANAGELRLRLHLAGREELGGAAFVMLSADRMEFEAELAQALI